MLLFLDSPFALALILITLMVSAAFQSLTVKHGDNGGGEHYCSAT